MTATATAFDGSANITIPTSVTAIRGVAVVATAPTTGQVLTYNGTNWTPGSVSGATISDGSITGAKLTNPLYFTPDGSNQFGIGMTGSGTITQRMAIRATAQAGLGSIQKLEFSSFGGARLMLDTAVNIQYSGLNIYNSDTTSNARGIIQHSGNSSGINSLGGLQIAAQGAFNSGNGSGNLYFLTSSDSGSATTDGAYNLRLALKTSGNVGFGTASPSYFLGLNGDIARTIGMERNSTTNTAGNNLTLSAGAATSGATDKNGGDLLIASGVATGTGSSNIYFYTSKAGATGTADNAVGTAKMILAGDGTLTVGTAGVQNGNITAAGTITAVQGTNGLSRISITNSTTVGNSQLSLVNTGANGQDWRIVVGANNGSGTNGVGVGEGNLNIINQTEGATRLVIQKATGNVTIGATLPATKLDVAGGLKIANEATACPTVGAGALRWNGTQFQGCDGTSWAGLSTLGGNGTINNPLYFTPDGSNNFAIGMAGSGTDAQKQALRVNATAGTGVIQSIALATGGSDRMTITSSGLNLSSGSTTYSAYNTADQITNYERFQQGWNSNTYEQSINAGGTGNFGRALEIGLKSWGGAPTGFTSSLLFNPYTTAGNAFGFRAGTNGSNGYAVLDVGSVSGTFAASSGTQYITKLGQNINQTGTAGYTGLLINTTETTTGSGVKRLIDAQVGSASKFTVTNTGAVSVGGATPSTMLDVAGPIRTRSDTTAACVTVGAGAIRWNGTAFQGCDGTNWTAFTLGGGGSVNLGASAAAASPQISGDATTGFYTAGAGLVDVAISGVKVAEWSSTGGTLTGTFQANNTASGGVGIRGFATNGGTGVFGNGQVANGIGVAGTSSFGGMAGVKGQVTAQGFGYNNSSITYGGWFTSDSTYAGSASVYATMTGTSGATYAGYFTTASTGAAVGIYGSITGASNTGYAGYFLNNSASGWGIYSAGSSPNYFNGKVGIGSAAPATLLQVGGASSIGTDFGNSILINGSSGGGYADSASSPRLYFEDTSGSSTKIGALHYGGDRLRFSAYNAGVGWGQQGIVDINFATNNTSLFGALKIGDTAVTCATLGAGAIRWNGTAFQGCDGTNWAALGGGGSVANPLYFTPDGSNQFAIGMAGSAAAAARKAIVTTADATGAILNTVIGPYLKVGSTASLVGEQGTLTVITTADDGYQALHVENTNGAGNELPAMTVRGNSGDGIRSTTTGGFTAVAGASDDNGIGVAGTGNGAGGIGVFGNSTGAIGYGVYGANAAAAGVAVRGDANNGAGTGVLGASASITAGATGVRGTMTGTSGATYAGYFSSASTAAGATGIYITSAATAGWAIDAVNTGSGGTAIRGTANTGAGVGVFGATTSTTNFATAIAGKATGATGTTYGGYFTSATTGAGVGVYGDVTGASNTGYAGYFSNSSTSGWGLYSAGTSANYLGAKTGIGSGTTAPTTMLDVAGPIRTRPDTTSTCATVGAGSIRYNAGIFQGCNGTTWSALGGGGSSSLGASVTAAAPSISGDATTGFYTAGAGLVDVTISGVKVAEWSSIGETITGTSSITSSNDLEQLSALTVVNNYNDDLTTYAARFTNASTYNGWGIEVYGKAIGGSFTSDPTTGVGVATSGNTGVSASGQQYGGYFTAGAINGTAVTGFNNITNNTGAAGNFSNTSANGWSLFSLTGRNYLAGNTGIGAGTSAPTTTLDVGGPIRTRSDTASVCATVGAGSIRYNAGTFEGCNGTAWSTLGGGGGSSNLGASTSATAPSISGDATTGFYTGGAGYVNLAISGNNLVTWSQSGQTVDGVISATTTGFYGDNRAVSGTHSGATGTRFGGYFSIASSDGGAAVVGTATSSSAASTSGGSFQNSSRGSGTGVSGEMYGSGNSGRAGSFTNGGPSNTGYAGSFYNNSSTGWGVYATGAAPNYFAASTGIGSGTTAPTTTLDVAGPIRTRSNTTAVCSTVGAGSIRYNASTFEGCNGTAWSTLGGGSLGTSASATSPGRSGDATTGLYSAGASLVDIAIGGTKISEWSSTGQTLTGALTATNGASGGNGVYGAANTGASVGVYGYTSSTTTNAAAVQGWAQGGSGNTYGGFFRNSSTGTAYAMAASSLGTSNTGYAAHISNSSTTGWGVYSTAVRNYMGGKTGFGSITAPAEAVDAGTGNVRGASFINSSDRRLKHDIVTFDHGLDTIRKIRGVRFTWNESGERAIGLIAQEIEPVLPELIREDGKGIKAVMYANIVAPLIEAVKELADKFDALEAKLALLLDWQGKTDARLEELERKLGTTVQENTVLKDQNARLQSALDKLDDRLGKLEAKPQP